MMAVFDLNPRFEWVLLLNRFPLSSQIPLSRIHQNPYPFPGTFNLALSPIENPQVPRFKSTVTFVVAV